MHPTAPHRHPARARRALAAVAATLTLTTCVVTLVDQQAGAAPVASVQSSSPAIASAANQARSTLLLARRTASPALVRRYVEQRNLVAMMVATELGVDPKLLVDAWVRADQPHEIAVLSALSQLGVPYEFLGNDPYVAFGCSGLTSWAWAQAGAGIAHQSSAQIDAAAPRDRTTAQAGDLVQYPGHVMMYLGAADLIVHAPNSDNVVNISFISEARASEVRFGDPVG